jgi:hypothetical protein
MYQELVREMTSKHFQREPALEHWVAQCREEIRKVKGGGKGTNEDQGEESSMIGRVFGWSKKTKAAQAPVATASAAVPASPPVPVSKTEKNPDRKAGKMVAYICAVWTLLGSNLGYGGNNSAKSGASLIPSLMQPHPSQILTIFRLLGIGSVSLLSGTDYNTAQPNQKNHFAQVGTGEGKSISLGIVATIFGLFGYSVNVVCYTERLSSRDLASFSSLFHAFSLLPGKCARV